MSPEQTAAERLGRVRFLTKETRRECELVRLRETHGLLPLQSLELSQLQRSAFLSAEMAESAAESQTSQRKRLNYHE